MENSYMNTTSTFSASEMSETPLDTRDINIKELNFNSSGLSTI